MSEGHVFEPFSAPLSLADAKYHGLRALCGLLMDRHSNCTICPFCGNPDSHKTLIVSVEGQTDVTAGNPILALYFSRAVNNMEFEGEIDPLMYAATLTFYDEMPHRKAAITGISNEGVYLARYGQIENPLRWNYAAGRLAQGEGDWVLRFYCDPEPNYALWEYTPANAITQGQRVTPEFCVLLLRDEWWIVDRDRERGMYQQVAALSVADNPAHSARLE